MDGDEEKPLETPAVPAVGDEPEVPAADAPEAKPDEDAPKPESETA